MTTGKAFRSSRATLPDSQEEITQYFYSRRMTDGLPIVPPTEDRVARMVEASGRKPDEVIGKIAPLNGEATVEKIAINAVMAGCAPEYMPTIIAAASAISEQDFNLHGIQCTTNAVGPIFVINGPVRKQIDINCGAGVLGPGWRANATIGRAMRLIMLNVGGGTPGDVDKATQGWPGKYTCCVIGEWEEKSPWEPLHVERGFKAEESTVTAFGVDGSTPASDLSPYPEQVLAAVTHGIVRMPILGTTNGFGQQPFYYISLLNPVFAEMFGKKLGHTKRSLKEYYFEHAWYPGDWVPESNKEWLKPVNGRVPMADSPDSFHVIVAGGEAGFHVTSFSSVINVPITKRIAT